MNVGEAGLGLGRRMAAAGLSRGLAGEQKLQQTFSLEDGQLAAKKCPDLEPIQSSGIKGRWPNPILLASQRSGESWHGLIGGR